MYQLPEHVLAEIKRHRNREVIESLLQEAMRAAAHKFHSTQDPIQARAYRKDLKALSRAADLLIGPGSGRLMKKLAVSSIPPRTISASAVLHPAGGAEAGTSFKAQQDLPSPSWRPSDNYQGGAKAGPVKGEWQGTHPFPLSDQEQGTSPDGPEGGVSREEQRRQGREFARWLAVKRGQ